MRKSIDELMKTVEIKNYFDLNLNILKNYIIFLLKGREYHEYYSTSFNITHNPMGQCLTAVRNRIKLNENEN